MPPGTSVYLKDATLCNDLDNWNDLAEAVGWYVPFSAAAVSLTQLELRSKAAEWTHLINHVFRQSATCIALPANRIAVQAIVNSHPSGSFVTQHKM